MRDVGYVHARAGAALGAAAAGRARAARASSRRPSWPTCARSGRRARSGSRCASPGSPRAATRGLELLRESVAVLADSPALLERAHSLAELGAALRRAGQRAAAREPLAEALDLAARCGARPLAARAREELKATGARPRREWRTGVEALTPSELRVARLAAEGRTNREIAHELYVTLKTVEGHLARAYAKLGIDGRASSQRPSTEKRPGCQPSSERPTASATLRLALQRPKEALDDHDHTRGVRERYRHLQRPRHRRVRGGARRRRRLRGAGGMRGEGKAACVAFFGGWFDAFPDAHVEVHAFTSSTTSPSRRAPSPARTTASSTPRPATSRRPAAGQRRLHPGAPLPRRQARSFNLMFDRLSMLEQLGLVPGSAPLAK